uniref:Uncharacterized protein n=1 Tax=Anguilla anguilla TaxID=7936 RepID=A0A0E9UN08_ANGAN
MKATTCIKSVDMYNWEF